MVNIRASIIRLWSYNRPLTAVSLLMVLTLALNLTGLLIDRRIITGAPAWLKPSKFAVSVLIFTGTLAWVTQFITRHARQARWAARIVAICLVIEIAIIDLQAARGTSSHFNFRTPLDGFLFGVMGTAILILLLASVWIAILLFRQSFADAALGWALRLGMLITVFGAASGGLMTRPTTLQKASFAHTRPAVIGGHTVGAPDGGPGLPGVNWSTSHGDLRIAHFLGLHGVQAVPLLFALFIRRRPKPSQTRLVISGAASYATVAILLGWQALRGQSIVDPDSVALTALALWAVTSASSIFLASARGGKKHLVAAATF